MTDRTLLGNDYVLFTKPNSLADLQVMRENIRKGWVTNLRRTDLETGCVNYDAYMDFLKKEAPDGWFTGRPAATATATVEQIEAMGMIGVYKKPAKEAD